MILGFASPLPITPTCPWYLGESDNTQRRFVLKGFRAGVGMAIGAGLGLVFGLLFIDDWWIGPAIGVSLGLIVGAIIDLQTQSEDAE